jgi:decaprenyl-phosphate phosphoribosyltransferase
MSLSTRPPGPVTRPDGAGGALAAVLRTARPRQWLKNLLVFAAPAAAGTLLDPVVGGRALWTLVVFVLASASTYFVNDARDVEADRKHPVKCRRPVAAGLLRPRTAMAVGVALALLAPVLALPLGWRLVAVVAGYLGLTFSYSFALKNQPVLDILAVAAGFVLRAVAGGVATGVPLSNWFLLVVLFGSLFLVTAKRAAEERRGDPATRATLGEYPPGWLPQIVTMSLTGVVLTYATWALQQVTDDGSVPLALSVVPFLAVLLRYSLLAAQGDGEEPETVLSSDRFLLVAGAIWAVLVGGALYVL